MRPGNYPEQARTYDDTRRASPSILSALLDGLGPPDGRRLLDLAGGTGNYAAVLARAGFRPMVADAEPAMLARAAAKLPPGSCVAADGAALPFPDGSFDCATIVSAFHLFEDKLGALREVRRVLRDGPLAMQVFARENLIPLFTAEYFDHPMHEEVRESRGNHVDLLREAGFASVEVRALAYRGLEDGSLSALHTDPALITDESRLRNTSYWQRLDEQDRRAGLAKLRRALADGSLEEQVRTGRTLAREHGHVTVLVARP